jgi:hypothetical protein
MVADLKQSIHLQLDLSPKIEHLSAVEMVAGLLDLK